MSSAIPRIKKLFAFKKSDSEAGAAKVAANAYAESLIKTGLIDLNPNYEEYAVTNEEPLEVDVVAIHGLNGNPISSWTQPNSEYLWLRDSLPKELPGARVFSYGYPAKILFSPSKATLHDMAQNFLVSLESKRLSKRRRPIIFLAHSMGGIVCKKALILAQQDPIYRPTLEDCVGLMTFGTPHGGSDLSAIGGVAADLFNLALFVSGGDMFTGRARADLIKNLDPRSQELLDINLAFRHIAHKFCLVSFYETQETPPIRGRLIVDQHNATSKLSNEDHVPIYRNHRDMIRLAKGDNVYETVVSKLRKLSRDTSSLEQAEKEIVRTLYNVDVLEYRGTLPIAAEGTCKWIFQHSQYQLWEQDASDTLLWMSGHPGSGKTVMSSFLIDSYENRRANIKHSALTCFFLCNENIEEQNNASAILRSLLFQILTTRRRLVNYLKTAIDRAQTRAYLLNSFDRLWQLFEDILNDENLGSIHIVIDALDECQAPGRLRLVRNIAKLLSKSRKHSSFSLKFFISSRPYVRLDDIISASELLHIPLEETKTEMDRDLDLFISQRVNSIGKRFNASQATLDSTKQSLIQKADRTFLWAHFVLQILDEELSASPRDFARIVEELPQDLEDVYLRFLEKISHKQYPRVMKVIQALVVSFRPLSCQELNVICNVGEAVSMGCRDVSSLEGSFLTQNMERYLRSALGPLIRISDHRVYLVHISLKEFLAGRALELNTKDQFSRYHINMEKANLLAATSCLEYMSLEDFEADVFTSTASSIERQSPTTSDDIASSSGGDDGWMNGLSFFGTNILNDDSEKTAARSQRLATRYGFFDYAARHWPRHFAQCQNLISETSRDAAMSLLNRKKNHHRSSNWAKYYACFGWQEKAWPEQFDLLAIVCFFGHTTLLEDLLRDSDVPLASLQVGLYWASSEGHADIVRRLLKTTVVPDARNLGSSPLGVAAVSGHIDVAKSLLRDVRVDVNSGGDREITPLSEASTYGHLEIVDLLLQQPKIMPDKEDHKRHTPLIRAIWGGHEDVVRRLLADSTINPSHEDSSGNTAITYAAMDGKVEIIRMLVNKAKVDVNHANNKGRTAFSLAAGGGHVEVLRQLKGYKASKGKDTEGRNAYSWAASGGHVDAIKVMVGWDIKGIDEPDKNGWTPLFWALEPPSHLTMLILLETGSVNIHHPDHSGRTVVEWAGGYSGKETFLQDWLTNRN